MEPNHTPMNTPEKIYLHTTDAPSPFDGDERAWSEARISHNDVEYIRADLQPLALVFHGPKEKPGKDETVVLVISAWKAEEGGSLFTTEGAWSEAVQEWYSCDGMEDMIISAWVRKSDLLAAFTAWQSQKGAGA